MDIPKLNEMDTDEAGKIFSQCCGSSNWISRMVKCRPYSSEFELIKNSEEIWFALNKNDWIEAFEHHPRIGDLNSLKEKYSDTKLMAGKEQSGVESASDKVLSELSTFNKEYENKFGYIFIVCATGKSADEMLSLVRERIHNSAEEEIHIAAAEQNKITKLRLEKLL